MNLEVPVGEKTYSYTLTESHGHRNKEVGVYLLNSRVVPSLSAQTYSIIRSMTEKRSPKAFWHALLFSFACSLFIAPLAYAADFSVTPAVIDGKGKTREILRYTLSVENDTKHMLQLYPWVADLDALSGTTGGTDLGGGSPGEARAASPARWIEVTRAVIDLLPGEKKDIPILLQIDMNATPGIYHAFIHLSDGTNRAAAEANAEGTRDVAVNIEVLDDVHERLELNTFVPDKNFFSGNDASFNYRIENIGNRGVTPMGKIHIFDRRGEEVAAIDANKDARRLEPNQKELLASVWAADGHFGRYKAMLELDYGVRGVVQDTVYFWIMPWTKLLGMFATIGMMGIILALVVHSWGLAQRGPRRRFVFSFADGSEENVPSSDYSPYDDDAVQQTHVNGITEVAIPPRARTRYSVTSAPSRMHVDHAHVLREEIGTVSDGKGGVQALRAHTDGHKVHLIKKEKHIDPDHIVTLGRRK